MLNVGSRVVTPIQCAKRLSTSTAFRLGYEDYNKAREYNYDISSIVDGINYARGRSFAIWCKANKAPRATWRNGVAAKTVVDRIIQAIRSQYVI
jgi:hypothetical protein